MFKTNFKLFQYVKIQSNQTENNNIFTAIDADAETTISTDHDTHETSIQ